MARYVSQPAQTAKVLTSEGWYLGLGDKGFWLPSTEEDTVGEQDLYWYDIALDELCSVIFLSKFMFVSMLYIFLFERVFNVFYLII